MKTTTRNLITASLLAGPKTVRQIMAGTELSRITIDNALPQLADKVAGTWPYEYELIEKVDTSEAVQVEKPASKAIPAKSFDLAKWNRFISPLSSAFTIDSAKDLSHLLKQFVVAIDAFEQARDTLELLKDKPDWFDQLGGKD
jgi:hypothetical protein